MHPVLAITSNQLNGKEHHLVQVQLHNECCEEMDTRMNLSKLSLNLNLKQTFSHAEDMMYAGIKIKELEKNISEQECR